MTITTAATVGLITHKFITAAVLGLLRYTSELYDQS